MSAKDNVLSVFGLICCFGFVFFNLRGHMSGMIYYQLNNNAYKKRKKGQTFKEWLFNSRFKEEIPKVFLLLYYFELIINPFYIIVYLLLIIINSPYDVLRMFFLIACCSDFAMILLLELLFRGHGDEPYARWIKRKRGRQTKL